MLPHLGKPTFAGGGLPEQESKYAITVDTREYNKVILQEWRLSCSQWEQVRRHCCCRGSWSAGKTASPMSGHPSASPPPLSRPSSCSSTFSPQRWLPQPFNDLRACLDHSYPTYLCFQIFYFGSSFSAEYMSVRKLLSITQLIFPSCLSLHLARGVDDC